MKRKIIIELDYTKLIEIDDARKKYLDNISETIYSFEKFLIKSALPTFELDTLPYGAIRWCLDSRRLLFVDVMGEKTEKPLMESPVAHREIAYENLQNFIIKMAENAEQIFGE